MFPGSDSFRGLSEIPVPTADSQPGERFGQQVPSGPQHESVFTQFVPHLSFLMHKNQNTNKIW